VYLKINIDICNLYVIMDIELNIKGGIMDKIKIIDSPMGYGKTTWLINMINQSNSDERFIFVTPFLDEVKRVKNSCKTKWFVEPTNKNKDGSKMTDFENKISKNKNIVTTHALFSMCSETVFTLLKNKNYTLILDEVMDVVEKHDINQVDIDMLFSYGMIAVDDTYNNVTWNDEKYEDYSGKFSNIKQLCHNEALYYINNTFMCWSFPVKIFDCFKNVYISTFMFDAQIQKYYYDYFEREYEYYHVLNGELIPTVNKDYEFKFIENSKSLLNILNHRINSIGDYEKTKNGVKTTALSKTWYKKSNENILKEMKNNLNNYFRHIYKTKSTENLWTTFKDYELVLKGKGYSKGFIPCNTRATNEYIERKNCAYMINVYLNPFYRAFFYERNIMIDEDKYALSEMLQWIWRSRIRNGEPINLYIPSQRMRELLINYFGLDFENSNLQS